MNIELRAETQKLLERKMADGGFATLEEVVLAALHALKTENDLTPAESQALDEELAKGFRDVDEGRVAEWNKDEIRQAGMELLNQRQKVG